MICVKNGDLDKLGLLFERYYRRLFGYFYKMTSCNDVSEDLVQNVFERVIKYRKTYNGEGAFSAWIFGIARNIHADYYRKLKADTNNDTETDWDMFPCNETEGTDLHLRHDAAPDLQFVRQALERLDPDKRQALILSRYEGFRYREIAAIMNCSEGAVKVRVFRALKEMKMMITVLRKQEKI